MREDFENRLPKQLGQPYTMNTLETPIIFVAFFPAQLHKMQDGSIINGNEIRLLEYGSGFKAKKMLAAIIGLRQEPADFVLIALRDQGTRSKDLKPYGRMIKEMLAEATYLHDCLTPPIPAATNHQLLP